MKLSDLSKPVLMAVLTCLAITASAQDAPSSFDADSFFGGGDQVKPAALETNTFTETDPPVVLGDRALSEPVHFAASLQPSGLVLTGEASTDLVYLVVEPLDSSARSGGYNGVSSLRLDATGGDRNEAKIEASVVVRMVYGEAAEKAREDLNAALAASLGGTEDLVTALLLGSAGPLMSVDLKKLYLSVYTPMADISVGRMIVNYGRGTIFSPVDLFSGVDTGDISLGRTGNDALRILFPFGNFSGLDLVATISDSPQESIAGGRFFGPMAGWDFGLSAFRDGSAGGDGDLVLGLDLKGDLEVGVSAEAQIRLPFSAGSPDSSEAVYSLMAGLDYSLMGVWFLDLEYLWNIRAGQSYPLGGFRQEHNLFASLSWKPDELTALDIRTIVVPAKTLGQLSLGVSRSIARGASLMGFALFRNGNIEGLPQPSAAGFDLDATNLSAGARLSVSF